MLFRLGLVRKFNFQVTFVSSNKFEVQVQPASLFATQLDDAAGCGNDCTVSVDSVLSRQCTVGRGGHVRRGARRFPREAPSAHRKLHGFAERGERPWQRPSAAACANERAALRQRNSKSRAKCPLAARRDSVGVRFLTARPRGRGVFGLCENPKTFR